MFKKKTPDVVVVGAGPTGLFCAASLAARRARVRIIDSGWRPAAHSYALALHPSSLRLLRKVGLPGNLLDDVHRIHRVSIYDLEKRRATFDFSQLDTDNNYIGVLPQSRLEEALETLLHSHGINVEWNHRLSHLSQDEEGVDVVVDRMTMESLGYAVAHREWIVAASHEIRVPFVIGADGHGSMVRRSLDIDFENAGKTRYFGVFEFKTDFDLQNELRVVLGKQTTSVLWPLPNGYCRWGFELLDFAAPPATRDKDRFLIQREELPELSPENFSHLVESRAPWFNGSVEKIEWKTVVRFEQRLGTLFGRNRSWLIGDAAHVALPIAVQSMNSGLEEGHEIADTIADIMQGKSDSGSLSDYGARNLTRWRRLLGLEMERIEFAEEASTWVREHARRIATSIPASGENRRQILTQAGVIVDTSTRLATA